MADPNDRVPESVTGTYYVDSQCIDCDVCRDTDGWRYTYEDSELEELAMMLPKNKTAYIFFNNIRMTEDAAKFQEILRS